ncbi:MAG: hypothetical protein J0I09_02325 [Sphingobacteriia bacterium]|nr:hypothetical protein [Sphingobacteriia bacterium]
MKKLSIVMLLLSFVITASAQRKFYGGGYYRPRTVVVQSYYPSYGYGLGWGLGWGLGYGYYGYPYYANPIIRPSKLDNEIATINHDYDQKIASARMDKSLTRKQRRQEVRQLKSERNNAIDEARKNYYKQQ